MWLPEILTIFRDRLITKLPLAENATVAGKCWTTDTIYIGVNSDELLIYDGGPYIVVYANGVDVEAHSKGGGFINRDARISATCYYSNSCSENKAYEAEKSFLMQLHRAMIAAIDYLDSAYMLTGPSVYDETFPIVTTRGNVDVVASTVTWQLQPQPSGVSNA